MHVLICGGGIVGLALAQGCKKRGIDFTVFEKDSSELSRAQGWGLTLQWGLPALAECLPSSLMDKLQETAVRRDRPYLEGGLPVLNASTGEVAFRIPAVKGRDLRVNRSKLRQLLMEGIDVQWEKDLASFQADENGVVVKFTDGSSASGDILIGADGAKSRVRSALLGTSGELNRLPYRMAGVISRCTYAHVRDLLEIGPWYLISCDAHSPTACFFALQELSEPADATAEMEAEILNVCSWRVTNDNDDVKETDEENLKEMKRRASAYADPLRSVLLALPPDSKVQPLKLADWLPVPYDSPHARVVLAGDAAHTMTMFRGEGVNYGFVTCLELLKHLSGVQAGTESREDAVRKYEMFAREKGAEGVLLSRAAGANAHDFGTMTADSPYIARVVK